MDKEKKEICNNLIKFYEQCKTRPYEYHHDLLHCNIIKKTILFIKCNK